VKQFHTEEEEKQECGLLQSRSSRRSCYQICSQNMVIAELPTHFPQRDSLNLHSGILTLTEVQNNANSPPLLSNRNSSVQVILADTIHQH